MLKLVDLLSIKEDAYTDYKIHLATGHPNKMEPYRCFLIDQFKQWQEEQTSKNWSRKYIISLKILKILLESIDKKTFRSYNVFENKQKGVIL